MRSITSAIMAIIAAAAMALPATAAELIIDHAQGRTVLADTPKKVIVFDVASLDTLAAVDADVAGVPKLNLPDFLSRYAKTPQVGSLFEPDYEAVAAAEPDLIIVGGRSAAKYADLAKIAPTVDLTVDRTRFIDSVKERADILGRIFDKTAEVDALKAGLDASIEKAKAVAPKAGKSLFVMTNGARVIAFGPGSRFGWVHDVLGLEPVSRDIKAEGSHGEAISFEYILERNPDTLLVLDRDAVVGRNAGVSAAKTLDNEIVAGSNAWKNGKVIYIDAQRLYLIGNGLVSTKAVIDQIAAEVD
jgi:iron complex transport system substrate-binding protein